MMIFHVVRVPDWLKFENETFYEAESLVDVGFLHCAALKDLIDVANCYYRGAADMLLLCIDTDKVNAEIKWETSEYGVSYPHIHGRLNKDAIVEVMEFPSGPDGKFIFLQALERYR